MSRARYSQLFLLLLVAGHLICRVKAQAPAPADNGLLLPVALGFLLKVVLVVLGGMVKLLFLGLTSLGTSGVSLLLALLFLKGPAPAWPAWAPHPPHPPAHGWHDREWLELRRPHGVFRAQQRSAGPPDASQRLYKPAAGHPALPAQTEGATGPKPHAGVRAQ